MTEETKKTTAAEETAAEAEAEKAAETPAEESAEQTQSLKAKLEAAEKAAEAAKEQLLRTAAEYENFRKRSAREKDSAFGDGVSHAVTQILGILDTLEMAANAPTEDEAYKKGVLMTLDQAQNAFKNLGIEEIPALGLAFDPQVHNAVMQQPAAEGQESGTVVQVFQKGYKMGDKVVRHATVIVAE